MDNTVVKYQKYDEYKDSGVELLDMIPTDWKCLPIKYLGAVLDN